MAGFPTHFSNGDPMSSIHPLQHCVPAAWCLWGDGRIEELGRPFRHAAAEPQMATYMAILVVPLAACLLGILIHRLATRPRRISHSLPALTRELYRTHRLRMRERRLLEQVAQAADVAEPATLIVVPGMFDAASDAARQRLRFSARDTARLEALRCRLFGAAAAMAAAKDAVAEGAPPAEPSQR